MKNFFICIFFSFSVLSFTYAQDWQWAHRYGGSNNSLLSSSISFYNNQPHNLIHDAEGNAYLFGTYGGGTQINGEYLQEFADYYCGSFVAKFDCGGNVVWHKTIARSGHHICKAQYMVLKNNRIYLQGTVHIDNYYNTYFLDTTVYGSLLDYYYAHQPDSLTFPWIPYSDYTYIMELDLDGNIIDCNLLQLSHRFRWDLWYDAHNKQLPFTIDSNGNYYLLMMHGHNGIDGTQNFLIKQNDIPITDSMAPNTYLGYYMLKFDSNFNFQYIKPITECVHASYWSLEMHFYDMKCDSHDNIYLCGYIQVNDTTSNPSYPYDVELADDKHIYSYNKESNGFIMKMNSESEILWISQPINHGTTRSMSDFRSMLLDETSGNIYVSDLSMPKTDMFPDDYTIFGENDTLISQYEGEGIILNPIYIIACYDTAGNYKWYNCPQTTKCSIGSLAKYNDKLYAGVCWSSYGLVCGENTYFPSEQYQGTGAAYSGYSICEWDMQGNMTDVRQIYSTAQTQTEPYDTRINALGEIYTAGRFDNTIAFGNDTLFAYSESDMFIAKFGLPCQTYVYDTATFCYGDVVQGVTLTATGDYTFTYPEGGQEFDSIVLVHATVLPPLTIGLNDTTVCTAQQFYLDACGEFDSYQWSTGGAGCTEMLQFDNACTQSVSLTVTRGECSATRTISITAQVCDGITEPTATAMSLYPNPATDMVSIFGDGFLYATIIDLAGRTIIHTSDMNIDISGLRPDEYIVKVVKIDGETEEMKLVKQ